MREIPLKYGCNPNQKNASVYLRDGDLPVNVLNGNPGYINFLDALNAWQLVKELKEATGVCAAASFKHVSPAGAAIGTALTDIEKKIYRVKDLDMEFSPLASAYAKARGADRMSSFGDFIALSHECDKETAMIIKREVSDGIIAPSYSKEAFDILKEKKKGNYNIISICEDYVPQPTEEKQVFGISFKQERNSAKISKELFSNIVTQKKDIPPEVYNDMIISMIVLKYTQSNSVCYVKNGCAIGIGAGQQSRIHCTRLAGDKADKWFLRQAKKVLDLPFKPEIKRANMDNATDIYIDDDYEDILKEGIWQEYFTEKPEVFSAEEKRGWLSELNGVTIGSDAFFPFSDNIIRAKKSGVTFVVQPGGSVRDQEVIKACDDLGMVMAFTGLRLFHH